MLARLIEVSQLRNSALSLSWSYACKSSENVVFQLEGMTKKASDPMALFNNEVAAELANKQVEFGMAAEMGSAYGNLQSTGEELIKPTDVIKFAKTQKKDICYDVEIVSVLRNPLSWKVINILTTPIHTKYSPGAGFAFPKLSLPIGVYLIHLRK